jgi:hypothetical protein
MAVVKGMSKGLSVPENLKQFLRNIFCFIQWFRFIKKPGCLYHGDRRKGIDSAQDLVIDRRLASLFPYFQQLFFQIVQGDVVFSDKMIFSLEISFSLIS